MGIRVVFYSEQAAWRLALCQTIVTAANVILQKHGQLCLILPGGSTPKEFLPALFAQHLPWTCITIMPTDERCVADDEPGSNLGTLRHLAHGHSGAQATFVSLRQRQEALPLLLPRLCVLGVGSDGHFASVFPGDELSWQEQGPLIATEGPPPYRRRVSLTPAFLAASNTLLIATLGAERAELLRHPGNLPIQRLGAPLVDLPAFVGPG